MTAAPAPAYQVKGKCPAVGTCSPEVGRSPFWIHRYFSFTQSNFGHGKTADSYQSTNHYRHNVEPSPQAGMAIALENQLYAVTAKWLSPAAELWALLALHGEYPTGNYIVVSGSRAAVFIIQEE